MKRRIVVSVLSILLVVGVPVSAAALDYDFVFKPPFAGSMLSTDLYDVEQADSAYVRPLISATPTTYFLSPTPFTSTEATNYVTDISTSGKRSFTYKSGYGSVGNEYCLSGFPSNYDFVRYYVYGDWSP